MREIKIKVWDTEDKEWVNPTSFSIIENDGKIVSVDKRFVIVVSTNLKDKNGKEIFEGDILRFVYKEPKHPSIQEVIFEPAFFKIEPANALLTRDFINQDVEVIGNKFENPELLMGGEK